LCSVEWLLTSWHVAPPLLSWCAIRWRTYLVLALFAAFNLRFVVEGRRTPAPIAPTDRLVVDDPFRWVSNPGYVSVIAHSWRLSR
jgi:hypothetical protein